MRNRRRRRIALVAIKDLRAALALTNQQMAGTSPAIAHK
jgi:hypothetical protein